MYFTSFGGSALLHLLAGHPRLVAVLGIGSVVAILSSPLGPGAHLGADQYAKTVERTLATNRGISASAYANAERAVSQLITTHDPSIPARIQAALTACGTNCTDLSVGAVMQDAGLERDVLLMSALDQFAGQR